MMSDEDRDIDIESDDDDDDDSLSTTSKTDLQFASQAERRAHHNALERKRRDHIKDSFSMLRDNIPSLSGEKASRAQILKKAADYIDFMMKKNAAHSRDIDDLKRKNEILDAQIDYLEKIKYTGSFACTTPPRESNINENQSDTDTSEDNGNASPNSKKQKIV